MNLVKSSQVEWAPALTKGNYGQRRKNLGSTGKLSAGLWELAPGKKSFPFHMHHVTEEALFVVSGQGQVRGPDGLHPIGAGDWVGFPPGQGAHQLINDGTQPLVYVGLGVNPVGVDVVEYPDADNVATSIQAGPERQRFIFKKSSQVEYFDGEKDAQG